MSTMFVLFEEESCTVADAAVTDVIRKERAISANSAIHTYSAAV